MCQCASISQPLFRQCALRSVRTSVDMVTTIMNHPDVPMTLQYAPTFRCNSTTLRMRPDLEHSNVLLFLIKIPYVRNRSAEYVGRFAYTLVLIAILTLTVVSKATLLFRCQPALLILILSTACCSWYAYLHTYSGEYIYGSIYTTIL